MKITARERRWLLCVFDTILPPGPGLPIGARDLPLAGFVDDFFRVGPPLGSVGLRAALWLLCLVLTPLVLLRPRTFASASPEQRLHVLETLARSRVYSIRELPALFKLIASMGFFGHPDVQRLLAMKHQDDKPSPWFKEARK